MTRSELADAVMAYIEQGELHAGLEVERFLEVEMRNVIIEESNAMTNTTYKATQAPSVRFRAEPGQWQGREIKAAQGEYRRG